MPTEEYVDKREIMALSGVTWRRQGDWWMTFCPAHNDGAKHNGKGGESLLLSESRGVLICKAGCDFKSIMAIWRQESGIPLEHEPSQPTPIRQRQPDQLVTIYYYVDADGVVVAEKGRWEGPDGKRFTWRPGGSQEWPSGSSGLSMKDLPLYGLPLLLQHPGEPVYFVEGEKACDAAQAAGLIAVTAAGGASQKDFGASLEPLRGRTVHLWADNDAPGAAYMSYVGAQLRVLGCTVLNVQASLGPKEDAYDYFVRYHRTVDELDSLDPSKPVVSILGEDSIRIVASSAAGAVTFMFSGLQKTRREFRCELSVSVYANPDPYVEQLNLNSNSGTTALRRDLETVYGKEYSWTLLLNKVFGLVREAYLSQERGMDVYDLPTSLGEVLLVDPLLVADGPTIFFGDGGSMKSYLIELLFICMVYGVPFCGMRVPHLTPLVIDWEDSQGNFKRRLQRLADGIDPNIGPVMGVHYWDARGEALVDQVDALQRYIERHGIGVIAIDSAAPACGGDPLDHHAVLEFFGAVKKLGLPCVIIAHVTKSLEATKPFGSAYWHNEARRTWYVARATEEDSDEVDIGLFNRKVNDGRVPAPMAFKVLFSPDMTGPVKVTLEAMERAPEGVQQHTSDKAKVWRALGGMPRTVSELAEETGISAMAVDKILRRGPFASAGYRPAEGKGRPAQLWARQEIIRPGDNLAESGGEKYPLLYND